METINLNVAIPKEKLEELMISSLSKSFEGYGSNPLLKGITEAFKEKEAEIKEMSKIMIKDIISDPSFTEKLKVKIVERLANKALENMSY